MTASASQEHRAERPREAWLVIRGTDVPQPWRDRALEARLVPLLPGEVQALFGAGTARPMLNDDDIPLARLLAAGHAASDIASELGVSTRTVQRGVANLRRRFDVDSHVQLRAVLGRLRL